MSNQDLQTILGLMIGSLSVMCIFQVYKIVKNIRQISKNKKELSGLNLANETGICPGPHTWDQVAVAMTQIPYGVYNVCKDCGYVAGTGYKLNDAAREIYTNTLKIRAERQAKFDAWKSEKILRLEQIRERLILKYDSKDYSLPQVLRSFFNEATSETSKMLEELTDKYGDKDNG